MAVIGNLIVNLKARTAAFDKAMGRSQKRMRSFGGTFRSLAATIGVGLGIGAAVAGLRSMVRLASEAEETASKFEAVFKDQAAAARVFADDLGKAVGRSVFTLQAFLATLQDTFVPLGFARDAAREMSQTLTRLAIDIASFNNKADADVIRDLQSAIVGNTETVRKYGIIITQATLNQELLNQGIAGGVRAASEAEKAQGRLNLILAGSTDAQGDAIRTSGQFANQMKRFTDNVKDAAIAIGSRLLPIVSTAIETISSLSSTIKDFAKNMKPATRGLLQMVGAFAITVAITPRILSALIAIVKIIRGLAIGTAVLLALGGPAGIAQLAIGAVVAVGAFFALDAVFNKLNATMDETADGMKNVANGIPNAVAGLGDMTKQLERTVEKAGELGKERNILSFIDNLESKIRDLTASARDIFIFEAERLGLTAASIADLLKRFDLLERLKAAAEGRDITGTRGLAARESRFLTRAPGARTGVQQTNKLLTDQNTKTDATNVILTSINQNVSAPITSFA